MNEEWTEWKKTFCIFPKETRHGKKKEWGWLYTCTHSVRDCGRYIQWRHYVTGKDLFKLKLKGLA